MTKIVSKKGFSLLELIIASILVVIVVLGIFSVNYVLSNNNQDYGQRYFVKSETQTILNHIINNASLAIGSGTTINGLPDRGILVGGTCPGSGGDLGCSDPVNNPNTFCIHQDIDPAKGFDSTTVNAPPTTAPNYNPSRWLCYTWNAVTYQINYCAWPYNSSVTPGFGATNCSGAVAPPALYLGTASNMPSIAFNPTAGFSITIQNCLNNAAPSCNFLDPTKQDPANNPQVSVSGTTFPSQEGF